MFVSACVLCHCVKYVHLKAPHLGIDNSNVFFGYAWSFWFVYFCFCSSHWCFRTCLVRFVQLPWHRSWDSSWTLLRVSTIVPNWKNKIIIPLCSLSQHGLSSFYRTTWLLWQPHHIIKREIAGFFITAGVLKGIIVCISKLPCYHNLSAWHGSANTRNQSTVIRTNKSLLNVLWFSRLGN